LRKVTSYFIKMVLLVEFLVTAVQSFIISAELRLYTITDDTSCTGWDAGSFDLCEGPDGEDNCDGLTCDSFLGYYKHLYNPYITSWDSCYVGNFDGYDLDAISTCEDDGLSECAGEDICINVCPYSSTSATCDGPCSEHEGWTIPGTDCDAYRSYLTILEDTAGFTEFGECFWFNNSVDVNITGCPKASPTNSPTSSPTSVSTNSATSSSTNIGLIVGLVVGAVVLFMAIVALVSCKKSREKASNLKKTIEET